jgi:hypothetical protein
LYVSPSSTRHGCYHRGIQTAGHKAGNSIGLVKACENRRPYGGIKRHDGRAEINDGGSGTAGILDSKAPSRALLKEFGTVVRGNALYTLKQ